MHWLEIVDSINSSSTRLTFLFALGQMTVKLFLKVLPELKYTFTILPITLKGYMGVVYPWYVFCRKALKLCSGTRSLAPIFLLVVSHQAFIFLRPIPVVIHVALSPFWFPHEVSARQTLQLAPPQLFNWNQYKL
jgi:hypothetical protein